MKILYKPKPAPVECKRCGCLFKPKLWNLKARKGCKIKDEVICPVCNTRNLANFEKRIEEEAEG